MPFNSARLAASSRPDALPTTRFRANVEAAFRRAPSLIDFMRGVRRAKQLP